MDNKQVTKVGEKTRHLIDKIKDILNLPDSACLQFIMLCLMFDVRAMNFTNKDLDERAVKAIDILVNDPEFGALLDELKDDLEKAKEKVDGSK